MSSVGIPLEPDLVLVSWTRNPLIPGSARRITASRVIGSAKPCESKLTSGSLLIPAIKCLKKNGFIVVVSKRTTAVSGYLLLQRG
ncbi:hypothetical protein BK120_15115 [Paenibacillus sp. FSL A5-0031]|uniref:hypothetical protein n=1 Tax=Paenibacillus sp. FSL A5-0031 TaxID=1920420 RepID=UPI00096F3C45|nr:hypothetical protein [Paenibacillus sp. FSL A5-0031]OME83123.1 hypothetical protein BK120_15115 [Paenibacillus sp. FSL A5-0031]